MKRLIISPLVLALVLGSPLSAPVEAAAGSAGPSASADLRPSRRCGRQKRGPGCGGLRFEGRSLWAQVDDGTSFSAADDSATLVRTTLRSRSATHTTSFAGAPAGTVADVVVNLRASRSARARGTVRVRLYVGSTLLGRGAPHALTEAYTNFSDDFGGLSVADASNLRTTVKFTNTAAGRAVLHRAVAARGLSDDVRHASLRVHPVSQRRSRRERADRGVRHVGRRPWGELSLASDRRWRSDRAQHGGNVDLPVGHHRC